MTKNKFFRYKNKKIPFPLFFPDATRGFVRTLDWKDVESTKTPGVLVNTFHLYNDVGNKTVREFGGIKPFTGYKGSVISDSGGFQVMSLFKSKKLKGKITDKGILYKVSKSKTKLFTPEISMRFQMLLRTDLVVVLDDFTPKGISKKKAKETVGRTVNWAKRCKRIYLRECEKLGYTPNNRPYIIAVVQGGEFKDLRIECEERLSDIGFDGFGYGGWPITNEGDFDVETAALIKKHSPRDSLLYGLGIGMPQDIVACSNLGYQIFDCVLPTRDARHARLYVFNADSIDKISVKGDNFYTFVYPKKGKYKNSKERLSTACDCLLCTNYSLGYLNHLFKLGDFTAQRLATIHNLRFYSLLMKKLNNPSR